MPDTHDHHNADDRDCDECGSGTTKECRSPAHVPWLEHDRCMYFFEARAFECPRSRERIRLRIVYEHRLCLVGRQQGPLLYTTTLLPGETVTIFENDRYRRTRSETERVSVHTSFRQTLSALSEARNSASSSVYVDSLTSVRTSADTHVSAGGGLAGFLGLPSGSGNASASVSTTLATGSSAQRASQDFTQISRTASQAIEAERSLIVSSFEDTEHQTMTRRDLKNENDCYAVTYFVRRTNEVYEASTRVVGIEWQLGEQPWRAIDDLTGVTERVRNDLRLCLRVAPKVGDEARDERRITIPTDGTLYEAELAHCSSCEPAREVEIRNRLDRERVAIARGELENELLALEIERRRELSSGDTAVALALPEWSWSTEEPTDDEPSEHGND